MKHDCDLLASVVEFSDVKSDDYDDVESKPYEQISVDCPNLKSSIESDQDDEEDQRILLEKLSK